MRGANGGSKDDMSPERKVLYDATAVGLTKGQGNFTEEEINKAFQRLDEWMVKGVFLVLLLEGELGIRLQDDGEIAFMGGSLLDAGNEDEADKLSRLLSLEARLSEFKVD